MQIGVLVAALHPDKKEIHKLCENRHGPIDRGRHGQVGGYQA